MAQNVQPSRPSQAPGRNKPKNKDGRNLIDYTKEGVVEGLKDIVKSFSTIGRHIKYSPKTVVRKGMFDVYYFITVIGLLAFGLVMHYSASGSNLKQALIALGGIVLMIGVSFISEEFYREASPAAMTLATVLLALVFAFPEKNGTHRWMLGFQPSEIAKITLVMYLAYFLDKYSKISGRKETFWKGFEIVFLFALAILAESHLSGCVLFFLLGIAMMWYGNVDKKRILRLLGLAAVGVAVLVFIPGTLEGIPDIIIKNYQKQRVFTWKKILSGGELTYNERINDARQVLQSLYGIGSGGLIGKGYDNSAQKINNLLEEDNDFIFAVIGEELGFFGGILLFVCFAVLIARGFYIASKAKTYYGALLVYGISTQMALQVIINVCVATSILPNTGISLPFFSDGGSSLLFTLASMGLVLGVSKNTERTENSAE